MRKYIRPTASITYLRVEERLAGSGCSTYGSCPESQPLTGSDPYATGVTCMTDAFGSMNPVPTADLGP